MSDRRMVMYGAPPPLGPRRVGEGGFPLPPYIPTPPGEDPQRVASTTPAPDIGVDIGELLSREPVRLSTLRAELRAAEESIKAAISAEHEQTRQRIDGLSQVLRGLAVSLEAYRAVVEKAVKKRAAKKPAKRRAKTK